LKRFKNIPLTPLKGGIWKASLSRREFHGELKSNISTILKPPYD
jgi:hypothetical protein